MKKDPYKIPVPVEQLFEGEDVPVGSKLSVMRFGNQATLQLFSKHSVDKGQSILIERADIKPLTDILNKYADGIENILS